MGEISCGRKGELRWEREAEALWHGQAEGWLKTILERTGEGGDGVGRGAPK